MILGYHRDTDQINLIFYPIKSLSPTAQETARWSRFYRLLRLFQTLGRVTTWSRASM